MFKYLLAVFMSFLVAAPSFAGAYTSLVNCEQVVASNNKADKWRASKPPRWQPSNISEAAEYINESPWCTMMPRGANHWVIMGSTTEGTVMNLGLQIHSEFKPPHYFPSMMDYKVAMRLCYAPADLTLMPDNFVIRKWVTGRNAGHECMIMAVPPIGKLHSQGMKGR